MAVVTTLPRSRPLTRADLEAMPDDGHRYELIDGVLVVSPAPSREHQRAQMRLIGALLRVLPEGLEMLAAPFDVALADDTVTQPDIVIAPREAYTSKDLPEAPLLAIEILSPSTRRFDLVLKRSRYEAAGCSHYWVIDPEEPRIIAWSLRGGSYVEVADVVADEELVLEQPFPFRIVPTALVA